MIDAEQSWVQFAADNKIKGGVKLVRGTYLEEEIINRERAIGSVFSKKEEKDYNYNFAVKYIDENTFDIESNASGHCGKCKIKLISGEVHLDHSGGISREDISSGYILACCSFPKGNIEIS
ncbi:2Fe-2S iron-sulfur cluster binding domain-containing protein [Xenorhabdus sp. PB62.4]|uniref:2Fe-2S iron-sulfur cluster binding domain-containing protein n=1 Tax=Xenorhabdus sp. PB62.4 TaxID=1851573 RepID=UPI001656EB22|nr:2Fe-2S iron-sulfur cluster binding domain-containing protein [Xenorhabdus sp. PB62.4]MBC8952719.1 CDP-6-deoxy-delta-3,4-glucoseen reductase [Xenorhabdus sp. PB62.4]